MKLDLHVHSHHSGDVVDHVEKIVKAVKQRGLDGFALTDHNSTQGNKQAAALCKKHHLVFIPGVEVSTKQGHVLGLFVKSCPPLHLSAEETIRLIHKQHGIAIAAHPYDVIRKGVGDLVLRLPFDAVESRNSKTIHGNGKAIHVCEHNKLAQIGGSDAHSVEEVGNAYTEFSGDLRTAIKQKKTKAVGGFHISSVKSMIKRRLSGGVPLIVKY